MRHSLMLVALLAAATPATAQPTQRGAMPLPQVQWEQAPSPLIRSMWFASDANGRPLRRPTTLRADLGPVHMPHGRPFWLVVALGSGTVPMRDDAELCVEWRGPDNAAPRYDCRALPAPAAAPVQLAYPGPDTYAWPETRYPIRLWLRSSGCPPTRQCAVSRPITQALGTLQFGISGGDRMRRLARAAPKSAEEPETEAPSAVASEVGAASDSDARFTWPPPRPTTRAVLERVMLGPSQGTLGQVADRLAVALRRVGYFERSFYAVPGGFAMATQLEQIEFDGTPKPVPLRWSSALPPRRVFSIDDFVRALFTAPEGHYRVIVFVVSDRPFATAPDAPSQNEALGWIGGGLDRLPTPLAELRLRDSHACTALVYQFRKVGHAGVALANPDGATAAELQLQRSGILAALGR